MKNLKKHTRTLCLFIVLSSLCSCALKPIPSEYAAVKLDAVNTTTLGNGKVLLYNGAGILHSVDNTARLNVWIDGKSIGQIRPKEYLIIDLKNGKYEFKVLHIDMFNMTSKHQITVTENTKVIEIEPTITSNRLTVKDVLPQNFDKYIYRIDRK